MCDRRTEEQTDSIIIIITSMPKLERSSFHEVIPVTNVLDPVY